MSIPPASTTALRFTWYACPRSGAFVCFALSSGRRRLAQWVLPDTLPAGRARVPAPGVWLQAAPTAPASAAVAQGSCRILIGKELSSGAPALQQALQHGRLLLQLTNEAGESKTYSLIQLRAGGAAWLLGPASYYATSAARAVPGRKNQQLPASLS